MTRVETLTLLTFYTALMLLGLVSLAGCAARQHPHICGAGMTCMVVQ